MHLDVSVNHMSAVAIPQSIHHLGNIVGSKALVKALLEAQLLEQLAVRSILEDQVDALLVVEIPKQPKDIWMIQSSLNFELALKMNRAALTNKRCLVQHLDYTTTRRVR